MRSNRDSPIYWKSLFITFVMISPLFSLEGEKRILTSLDLPTITPAERGKFYELMGEIDELFNDHQVAYWAISGTLLGAIRHQGMIPWDDDLDLIIRYQDKFLLEYLAPEIREKGLEIVNYEDAMFKIFPSDGEKIYTSDGKEFPWKYPFADIFLIQRIGQKFSIVSICNPNVDIYPPRGDKKGWSLALEELRYPVQRVPFGPLQIPIPNRPEKILSREYGDDWREIAYLEFSHKEEKPLKSSKVKIVDYSAPPYVVGKFQKAYPIELPKTTPPTSRDWP